MSGGDVLQDVSMDVDIDEERTIVTVTGTKDAALVVESASGEEVYLPPEDFQSTDTEEGMATSYESPYDGAPPADSPYEAAEGGRQSNATDAEGRARGTPTIGLESTADGFRVLHPEPVTDLRLLR